jgi:CMP-N,N'-diacetyllegionaminic acid synthase
LNILAIIPARGGSKGVLRKNIKLLCGKPLIAWSIEAALKSTLISNVIVSTEDEEIAEVAKSYGAQVPFLRPLELAQDDTPGIAPVLHALDKLPMCDSVLLLQPTSPLRTTVDIDNCIEFSKSTGAQSIVSVSEPSKHPEWMYRLDNNKKLQPYINITVSENRQELSSVYALNGALYYTKTDWLIENGTFITEETSGYIMPPKRSIDIDTMLDWKLAELLLEERTK